MLSLRPGMSALNPSIRHYTFFLPWPTKSQDLLVIHQIRLRKLNGGGGWSATLGPASTGFLDSPEEQWAGRTRTRLKGSLAKKRTGDAGHSNNI